MSGVATAMESRWEWAAACDVQQGFMRHPAPAPATVEYSARCRQVHELGGDCYDFVPLAGNRLALAVGDASGKGLAAALMISNVQSSVRMAALFSGSDSAGTMGAVNRQVYATSLTDRYATMFYGVLDGAARTLRYVNAGQTPPIVMRPDGSIELIEAGGAPVGMFPDWPYEESALRLRSGDLVLVYTDGVVEAESPSGEEWGIAGLRRAAAENSTRSANDIVQAIFKSMDEFTHGRQTDDATLVVLRVQ